MANTVSCLACFTGCSACSKGDLCDACTGGYSLGDSGRVCNKIGEKGSFLKFIAFVALFCFLIFACVTSCLKKCYGDNQPAWLKRIPEFECTSSSSSSSSSASKRRKNRGRRSSFSHGDDDYGSSSTSDYDCGQDYVCESSSNDVGQDYVTED